MHIKASTGFTAAFALAANAFMIPSTMTNPEMGVDGAIDQLKKIQANTLELLDPIKEGITNELSSTHLSLDCHGCSYPQDDQSDTIASEALRPSTLEFEWSVSKDRKEIVLNGVPFDVDVPFEIQFPAKQIVGGDESHQRTVTVDRMQQQMPAADGVDAQLIEITVWPRYFEDGNSISSETGGVSARVLKDEEGLYTIADTTKVAGTSSEPAPEEEQLFGILPINPHTMHETAQHECPEGMPAPLCFLTQQLHGMRGFFANMLNRIPRPHGLAHGHMGKRPCRHGRKHGAPASLKGGANKLRPELDMVAEHPHPHHHMMHKKPCFMHRLRHHMAQAVGVFLVLACGAFAGFASVLTMFLIIRGAQKLIQRRRAAYAEYVVVPVYDQDESGDHGAMSAEAEEKVGLMQALEETAPRGSTEEALPAYKEREDEH